MIFLTIIFSCEYYDNRLEIINDTDERIIFETYKDSIPTTPSLNKTAYYLDQWPILPGDTTGGITSGKNGWRFEVQRSKNHKLNLCIFNVDSLKKYNSIDSLIAKQIYVMYYFTEAELDNMNWKIVIH